MIWIDTKEVAKNADILEILSSQVKVEERPNLPSDFILSALPPKRPLMVERKTINNLLTDLSTGHLWEQMRNALQYKEVADYCIVLETKGLWAVDRFRKWDKGSLMRRIESIELDWKVPIIPSYDPEWTAEWLVAKAKELDKPEEEREFPIRIKPPVKSIEEQVRFLLEGLPGVGPSLAKKLWERFGTARKVFMATSEQLQEVEKIGPKRAEEISLVLDYPYPVKRKRNGNRV
jgi:Fanconi anemia group M protein